MDFSHLVRWCSQAGKLHRRCPSHVCVPEVTTCFLPWAVTRYPCGWKNDLVDTKVQQNGPRRLSHAVSVPINVAAAKGCSPLPSVAFFWHVQVVDAEPTCGLNPSEMLISFPNVFFFACVINSYVTVYPRVGGGLSMRVHQVCNSMLQIQSRPSAEDDVDRWLQGQSYANRINLTE